jgi:hypothetical protein
MRWNPKTILGASAIVAAITNVLLGLLIYVIGHDLLTTVSMTRGQSVTSSQAENLGVNLFALDGSIVVFTLASYAILTGVLAQPIGQAVLGRKETLGTAWRVFWRRFWPLLGAMVLPGLFVVGGFIVAVILLGVISGILQEPVLGVIISIVGGLAATVFAIIISIRWYLTIPVVMLEGVGPLRAMGRSWRLVRRSAWRTWWIGCLASLIAGILNWVIRLPFGIIGGVGILAVGSGRTHELVIAAIVTAIGGIIASTLTAPLLAGVNVLIYADLRMRREGMDITWQASAASPDSLPGGAGPAPGGPGPASQNPGSW